MKRIGHRIGLILALLVCRSATPLVGNAQQPRTIGLAITVVDADEREVNGSTVSVQPSDGPVMTAPVRVLENRYFIENVPRERVAVTVAHEGFVTQHFTVDLTYPFGSQTVLSLKVQLGRPGDSYELVDGMQLAYRPRPDLLALRPRVPLDSLRPVLDSLGLIVEPQGLGIVIVRKREGTFDRWHSPELAYLRSLRQVEYAGPIRTLSDDIISLFSDRIEVRVGNPSWQMEKTLRAWPHVIDMRREQPGIYRIRISPEIGEGIVDLANALSALTDVKQARVEQFTARR